MNQATYSTGDLFVLLAHGLGKCLYYSEFWGVLATFGLSRFVKIWAKV